MNARVYDEGGRVLVGLLFLVSGLTKLAAPTAVIGYMGAMNVPGLLVWPVMALELLGGLALITRLGQRPVALTLAAFTLAATIIFHRNVGDPVQLAMALKNIAIVGALLMIARPASPLQSQS